MDTQNPAPTAKTITTIAQKAWDILTDKTDMFVNKGAPERRLHSLEMLGFEGQQVSMPIKSIQDFLDPHACAATWMHAAAVAWAAQHLERAVRDAIYETAIKKKDLPSYRDITSHPAFENTHIATLKRLAKELPDVPSDAAHVYSLLENPLLRTAPEGSMINIPLYITPLPAFPTPSTPIIAEIISLGLFGPDAAQACAAPTKPVEDADVFDALRLASMLDAKERTKIAQKAADIAQGHFLSTRMPPDSIIAFFQAYGEGRADNTQILMLMAKGVGVHDLLCKTDLCAQEITNAARTLTKNQRKTLIQVLSDSL